MSRCGCAGSSTFLLGSAANADAQNANVSTTLAHRTDEPHRRLNLFSILMPWSWFRFEFRASLFRGSHLHGGCRITRDGERLRSWKTFDWFCGTLGVSVSM